MKKIILILATLFSLTTAFGQVSSATEDTVLRAIKLRQQTPDWYFTRNLTVMEWVESVVAYKATATTMTSALALKATASDTVARKKYMTRKATDSLYVPIKDFVTYTKTGRKGLDTLFSVALATGKMAGGAISFTANTTDGTRLICKTGVVRFTAIDSVGTFKTSIVAGADSSISASGLGASIATYTQQWTIKTNTNVIYICVGNAISITPTSTKIYYSLRKGSDQTYTKFGN